MGWIGQSVTAILVWSLGNAAACSWIEPPAYMNTIKDRKQSSALTVHGIVLRSERSSGCGGPNLLLSLKVKGAFGSPAQEGDTVVIATPGDGAACGVDYEAGTEVVVFANANPQCTQPDGRLWTFLMNKNVLQPGQAQLDSLYGTPPVGIAGSAQGYPGYRKAAAFDRLGRNGNTVVIRNGMAGEPFRADGRALSARPVPGN